MSRPHVLYLGDWVFHVGPVFIETPFAMETKDCDLHFYGQRLADALGKEADLTTLANWQLYRLPPGKHTLQLVLGDSLHIPHDPAVFSKKITIEVE